MSNNTQLDTGRIHELEMEIGVAFATFAQDFHGLARHALGGEYFGVATYAAFERETRERSERQFWSVARQVEQTMIGSLEQWFDRSGIPRPDRALFTNLGELTAAVFAGEPHHGYCVWVKPLIDEALSGFRKLLPMNEDRQGERALAQLVAHEVAFQRAWALLPNGFQAAAAPLAAFLKSARSSQERFGAGGL